VNNNKNVKSAGKSDCLGIMQKFATNKNIIQGRTVAVTSPSVEGYWNNPWAGKT